MVLDDAELFGLGDDDDDDEGGWQRVYDVFPELAAPRAQTLLQDGDLSYIQSRLEWLTPQGQPQEEDWAEAVRTVVRHAGDRLLVVDRRAFETEEMGLVFRDAKGNVIRQGRVRADELDDLNLYNGRGSLHEQHFWLDSEVGEKYRVDGEVAGELVRIAKANSE